MPHRAISNPGPPSRWIPTHRRRPPAGFLNLSAACSPYCLAGLFHPASTSRLPLQGFSLAGSRHGSSPQPCPRAVTASGAPLRAAHPKLDFRALLSRRVRCGRSAVKRAERPIPSWASSSPGLPSPRPRTVLPRSAPHELASRPYGTALRRSTGFAQPRDGTSLARPPALLKFLALSIPQTFGRARDRAYRFASGGMPRHRCTVPHLCGPSPSPTRAA